MRTIYKIQKSAFRLMLAGAVILFSVTGCEDALETKVFTELTPDNFFKTEDDFNSALVTLYATFRLDWGNVDPGTNNTWYSSFNSPDPTSYRIKSSICTDEMDSQAQADLVNFTFGPSTWLGGSETVYSKVRYVARATDLIDKISNATGVNDEVRKKYAAEAKTLRAWIMYYIYDFFGPVNAKLDPATLSDNTVTPRLSDAEYVGQMEKDLLEAIPDLPDAYNGDAPNWGRVSKGVARMVLLKVYMHTKQWAKAEAIGLDIKNMGVYSLQANYADVFNVKANGEIIYAVSTNSAAPNYYPTEVLPGNVKGRQGWYGYWMPWSFYDKFDDKDERKSTILDSYVNTNDETIGRGNGLAAAIPLKYTNLQGTGPGYVLDVVIFRYADVLLSIAEAINEQRGPDEAYTYINEVRNRAELDDLSGLTKEQFKDAILAERGFELFAEGFRRQDLIRHGKFIENALARGKVNAQSHMVLMPIPSSVVIESKNVVAQNTGYPN